MPKRILIIDGHPGKGTFSTSLAQAYAKGAQTEGHEVRWLVLRELQFDPILHEGYSQIQPLEPDLQRAQADITWAQHVVWVFPNWWMGPPALLKGFVDRTLLPGFAFKYHTKDPFWDRLLAGRSARMVNTYDAPIPYNWFMYRSEGQLAFRVGVLKFSGFKPVKTTAIGEVKNMKEADCNKWIAKLEALGRTGT